MHNVEECVSASVKLRSITIRVPVITKIPWIYSLFSLASLISSRNTPGSCATGIHSILRTRDSGIRGIQRGIFILYDINDTRGNTRLVAWSPLRN